MSVRDEYLAQECQQLAEKFESLVEGELSQGIPRSLGGRSAHHKVMSRFGDGFAFWPIEMAQPGNTDRWEIKLSSVYVIFHYPSLVEHIYSPIRQGFFLLTGHGIQTQGG